MDYLEILKQFLKKEKADRIAFELQSKKKRVYAFVKLNQFESYFRNDLIAVDFSKKTDDEVVALLNKEFEQKKCFNLEDNQEEDLTSAVLKAINSYMCNVLIIDESCIIYIGEAEYGPSNKYILRIKK